MRVGSVMRSIRAESASSPSRSEDGSAFCAGKGGARKAGGGHGAERAAALTPVPLTIRLKSCVGPAKSVHWVLAAPSNCNGALAASSVCACLAMSRRTPAPLNTANQRSTPSKRENGPLATTSATDMRHCQSPCGGHTASSRVMPPPLRQGVAATSASAMRCQPMPTTPPQSGSASPGKSAAPNWPRGHR